MNPSDQPFFVGAWRRRAITVPGSAPVEPCQAWWVQTRDWFVDVRVTQPGHEANTLPYSQTRAFAGRFELVDGEARWHLLLDSLGLAPRIDRAPASGLSLDPDDPHVMIENAPGRFVEEWVRVVVDPVPVEVVVAADDRIEVAVGSVHAVVWCDDDGVNGEVTIGLDGRLSLRSS